MVLKQILTDKKIEKEVFKEILNILTFIEPQFVPRDEFNTLK
jgi:hypothetical protein